jgi:hypothetical protein
MNDMGPVQGPGGGAGATPVPAARLYGVIDVLRPNRVAGWVIDRADEAAAVAVDILRDGRVVASVVADRHRPDLQKGGIGTGRYGFLVPLDPPVDDGFEFTVSALARTADGHSLTLRPVPGTLPDVPPDRRLLQRLVEGMAELRAAQVRAALSAPGVTPEVTPEATPDAMLVTAMERIELVQARIEARLDALERPPAPPAAARFRLVSLAAVAVGAASLAWGVMSLLP